MCWLGAISPAIAAGKLDLRPKTLPRVSPSSQPSKTTKRAAPKKRTNPALKTQIPGVIKKELKRKRKLPWTLRTPVPFGVSLLGGLTLVITGVGLQNADIGPVGEGLVAGGTSLFLTVASAFMWWRPSTFAGVVGLLLGGATLAGGIAILAEAIPGLSPVSGWTLIGTTVLHIVFNVVGWLNLKHMNQINTIPREMRMQFKNAPPPKRSQFWSNFRVGPTILNQGAGVAMSGKF